MAEAGPLALLGGDDAIGGIHGIGQLDPVVRFELGDLEHVDGKPSQLLTDVGADRATDAFIEANLNGRNGGVVLFPGNQLNAIDRAKWDTGLTTGTVVLINQGHDLRLFLLGRDLGRQVGYFLIVIVGGWQRIVSLVQAVPNVGLGVGQGFFLLGDHGKVGCFVGVNLDPFLLSVRAILFGVDGLHRAL